MYDPQSVSVSTDYLNSLVKANDQSLVEIDKAMIADPKLKAQYLKDVRDHETMKMEKSD
jgi:hypothetical protein